MPVHPRVVCMFMCPGRVPPLSPIYARLDSGGVLGGITRSTASEPLGWGWVVRRRVLLASLAQGLVRRAGWCLWGLMYSPVVRGGALGRQLSYGPPTP
jgi:hypothetical protein